MKAVVAVTAMLGEMGAEGKARERAAVARLRAAGALLVGPNCLGVADTDSELYGVAFLDVLPGRVGLISQSGGFGEELNLRMAEYHLGYSRFVAIGNQADVDTPEVLRSFVGHEPTRAVVVYAEELRDGRAFARAAHELVSSGTPVVLLAPGRSAAERARGAHAHGLADVRLGRRRRRLSGGRRAARGHAARGARDARRAARRAAPRRPSCRRRLGRRRHGRDLRRRRDGRWPRGAAVQRRDCRRGCARLCPRTPAAPTPSTSPPRPTTPRRTSA